MKQLIKWFGVEIERILWLIIFGIVSIIGIILWANGSLSSGSYFIGQCILTGFGYIGSILKRTKSEVLNKNVKQLLNENKDSENPIDVKSGLDSLNWLINNAGQLLDQINKNKCQSKHLKNRYNNNKQILIE